MLEKIYRRYLAEVGVPENRHDQAIAAIKLSRKTFYTKVAFFKITAPFVVPFIIPFLKWEDEHLPKWARYYDNNISINGDSANWGWFTREDGVSYTGHLPQPLDKNVRYNAGGDILNYYAGKGHVREWWPRLVWLGTRNPGGGRARQVGPSTAGLIKDNPDAETEDKKVLHDITKWGQERVGKNNPGVQVLNIGEYWQIKASKKLFWKIGLDINVGWKINNLPSDYHPNNPNVGLCVCHATYPKIMKGIDGTQG